MTKNKYKISPLNIFRRLVQIIFFLFLPGIFTSAFYAIRQVYEAIITGEFTMQQDGGALLTIFAVILTTIFLGRFFCGFICSFGTMGDFIWFLSRKTAKLKFKVPETADRVLKYTKFVLLAFIVIVFWTLGVTIDSTVSPWNIFGMYAKLGSWPGAQYLFSIGGLLLLLIMIGSFFIERFFCRYLCPLGAVFAVVSKIRLFKINKKRDKCGSCTLCTKNCSMGIPLYKYDEITSGECINCFACVNTCPRSNVKANAAPAVASAISIAAVTGLVYAGTAVSAATGSTSGSSVSAVSTVKGKYTDGTYTGTGTGFRGETTVSVTVENGNITDITVESYQDDQEYFDRASSTIISEIIEAQDTDVDTVSGATFSSNGLIDAVADALSSVSTASATSSTEADSQATAQTADAGTVSDDNTTAADDQTTANSTTATGTFTDGTYTGSGTGFRGDTQVSVTVENGSITDVSITSYQDDEQFFDRAKSTVISEILSSQSVDVDTVSGATFSSNGIREAVANALGISFTNPNSSLQSEGGHGRGGFNH